MEMSGPDETWPGSADYTGLNTTGHEWEASLPMVIDHCIGHVRNSIILLTAEHLSKERGTLTPSSVIFDQ